MGRRRSPLTGLLLGAILTGVAPSLMPTELGAFVCGMSDTTTHRAGDLAPHTGDTKALVILVKFRDDNSNPNDCWTLYWPDSLGTTLPEWARDSSLIHPDTTSDNFVEGSLSDFWDTMSQGQYCFYGDVYDTVYITRILRPKSETGSVREPESGPFRLLLRHLETLLPPDPLHPLVIHPPAFSLK